MSGEIRVGRWMPFRATQMLSFEGFVWTAEAGRFPIRVRGFDRYSAGTGEMRWKLMGVVPVMSAEGPDVTRSAAGRLAGELMLLPGATLGADMSWRLQDPDSAVATVVTGSYIHDVAVRTSVGGCLESVVLQRWGNPDGDAYGQHAFGVDMFGDATFGGGVLPERMEAGWHHGTDRWSDGLFYRATIDSAEFF